VKRAFKLAVIGVVLWIELFLVVMHDPYPHGPIVDVPYRGKERVAARLAYMREPSPATKAVYDEELSRMRRYVGLRMVISLSLLVVANGIAIRYFLVNGNGKTTT
jgi:hypothetical protein